MALREGERALDAIRFRFKLEKRRVLRLSARATMVNHELTRHGFGNVSAEIFLDHGQCKIDDCGHSRGGPHRAVLDEDAIFFDTHVRVGLPKRDCVLPMGRDPLAFEKAGLSGRPFCSDCDPRHGGREASCCTSKTSNRREPT